MSKIYYFCVCMLRTNSQIDLAADFLRTTGVNIFLTGKAGTGKTTFLHNIVSSLGKRVVVAAPTGVAAVNARGVTLHSLFQLPFGPNIPKSEMEAAKDWAYRKMGSRKLSLIRSIELLVIDEISMVRSDVLDAVDETLRRVRHSSQPFGGVQLLMIGDVQQLSPICRDDEWELLRNYYTSQYFFDSNALKSCSYVTIELREIFRQSDRSFTDLLNAVRENRITAEVAEALNSRYIPNFTPRDDEGYITLTTHNARANSINSAALNRLTTPSHHFDAEIKGDYSEWAYPNDSRLELKVGAQVIFIKNDPSPEKLFYNGMIGRVTHLDDAEVTVVPNSGAEPIKLEAATWENIEYKLSDTTGEIEESVKGTYTQIPLKCAWAITIHKSQGLSFDKAIIDAGGSFAYGQVYVALSRCRTFEGMVLLTPIGRSAIIGDAIVEGFNQQVTQSEPSVDDLERYKRDYYFALLGELFDFDELNRLSYTISKLINSALYTQYPKLCDAMRELVALSNPELKRVGAGFKGQLQRAIFSCADYTQDSYVKERLLKASEYFLSQLSPFRTLVEELSTIKPDAKDVAKRFKNNYGDFSEALAIKERTLQLCAEGFTTTEYLRRKAEVVTQRTIKPQKAVREKSEKRAICSDIINQELYETLVAWRLDLAHEDGKPAYTILTNRAIIEIQAALPTTIERLSAINGIGEMKISRYGDELLEIVTQYVNDKSIDVESYYASGVALEPTTQEEKAPKPKKEKLPKEPKTPTHLVSLELFVSGMSVDEVAEERGFAQSTIYAHLIKCVSEALIEPESIVSEAVISKVRGAIDQGLRYAKDIFEHLGESVSYSEIRLVTMKYSPRDEEDK